MTVFRHSRLDAWLVALSFLHVAILLLVAAEFPRLSRAELWLLGSACVMLNVTNFQCIAHNFLHLPFFSSAFVNNAFAAVNSVALGMPQHLYRAHHLNHHRFNNDQPRDPSGETRDRSSLFRGSRDPKRPVHVLRYTLVGAFRIELGVLYREAKTSGFATQVLAESVFMIGFVLVLLLLDWRAPLFFALPTWLLGYAGSLLENYAEHYGARPGFRKADSVSCYNRMYNLLWFNNGYHQEHHMYPKVHWTKVRSMRASMLPETERRVCPVMHLTGLFMAVSQDDSPADSVQQTELSA